MQIMKFSVLTLFPEVINTVLKSSIIGRALKDNKFELEVHNLRSWATDKHKTVDDTPYGGGPGMLMKVDVIDEALADIKSKSAGLTTRVILLTPQGTRFTQAKAEQLAKSDEHLILIAGHYEGFDERIRLLVDDQISIGDFVLTGGELPATIIIDAVARLLPGVLGDDASSHEESFSLQDESGNRLLEYPQYTRPEKYVPKSKPDLGELGVPEVLLSGDHQKINSWRKSNSKKAN